jgi:cell wall-active antibiotic response 4TMS protein YvqF
MASGGSSHSIAFPLTLIAIGIILLLKEFGYLHGNIWRYWPVLLIVWGAGMIWAARKG